MNVECHYSLRHQAECRDTILKHKNKEEKTPACEYSMYSNSILLALLSPRFNDAIETMDKL
jgi:hypothetical protein